LLDSERIIIFPQVIRHLSLFHEDKTTIKGLPAYAT